MERVNVLIGWGLSPPLMERVAGMDPRVHLLNNPHEVLPRPPYGPPYPFPEQLLRFLPDAQVLFTSRLPRQALSSAPHLRWVQLISAGADLVRGEELRKAPFKFTTAVGIHPVPISEWVVGAMVSLVKEFPRAIRAQEVREYRQYVPGELAGRTAGILGMGAIGRRVAYLCKALDMRVIGVRRSVREPLENQGPADLLLPPRDLSRILEASDFLIICLPRTKETLGLLGTREIQQMKRGAYLINVGRGGIVDEEALVKAIRNGHLAGAALDVFDREPLPSASLLWDEPRVLMTPHIAGNSHRYEERAAELFMENLRCYLDGRDLLNVVDPERGY